MGGQLWHVAPGPQRSPPHNFWPIWNGGEQTHICASPRIATAGARTTTRTRGQADGTTRPPAYPSHGSGENQPSMDRAGSALLSFAAGAMLQTLSVNEARTCRSKRAVGGLVKMKAG